MHKTHFAGCDVSKATLDVCLQQDGHLRQRRFSNSPAGHKQIIDWLTAIGIPVRLALEATGNYSLDLALTLHAAEGIDLMVANPSATRQFARAQMRRVLPDTCGRCLIFKRVYNGLAISGRRNALAWENYRSAAATTAERLRACPASLPC